MTPSADGFTRYQQAQSALLALIDEHRGDSPSQARRSRKAAARLRRTHALLSRLGNPQAQYAVVHVTGTSGKGSTCAAIAAILTAAGYRVGLRTSPYLQVATEKLQTGSSLIDPYAFADLVDEVLDQACHLEADAGSGARHSYAEVWSGLAFTWFARRQVDIAVIEVGAGGRLDATNVVQPVVSVITSVGLDHVVSLGPTISDIAWHKAGIIKRGSIAVLGELPDEARSIVLDAAREMGAPVIHASDGAFGFSGNMTWFARKNAEVAYAAMVALRRQGFRIHDAAIAEGLATARMPGRLEFMPTSSVPVWIDGAHNPDKIAAVAREVSTLSDAGIAPVVVLGMLKAKDAKSIVSTLAGAASAIVATQPSVIGKPSLPAGELAEAVRGVGFAGPVQQDPLPLSALARAEQLALRLGTPVLATGSLYLAGELRRRWYRDEDIVRQRTSWPIARR